MLNCFQPAPDRTPPSFCGDLIFFVWFFYHGSLPYGTVDWEFLPTWPPELIHCLLGDQGHSLEAGWCSVLQQEHHPPELFAAEYFSFSGSFYLLQRFCGRQMQTGLGGRQSTKAHQEAGSPTPQFCTADEKLCLDSGESVGEITLLLGNRMNIYGSFICSHLLKPALPPSCSDLDELLSLETHIFSALDLFPFSFSPCFCLPRTTCASLTWAARAMTLPTCLFRSSSAPAASKARLEFCFRITFPLWDELEALLLRGLYQTVCMLFGTFPAHQVPTGSLIWIHLDMNKLLGCSSYLRQHAAVENFLGGYSYLSIPPLKWLFTSIFTSGMSCRVSHCLGSESILYLCPSQDYIP